MDLILLEKIKKLALVAIVSNDELMDKLVLKGGNAIDLIYQVSGRASIDLDFSMEREFTKKEISYFREKINKSLVETFRQEGMNVFDVNFIEKRVRNQYKEFWGGYNINFKVLPDEIYNRNAGNIDSLRRNAIVIGPNQERTFEIEISKFEYCIGKIPKDINGYRVYVYTTEMIVIEKIRSICQQVPEYKEIVRTHSPVARARDFFDIYILLEKFPFDLNNERIKDILRYIFKAKKVPLNYIKRIINQREFHRTDFDSVKDTVKSGVKLKEFDFYFDYVLERLQSIQL
jgi:hypothetical protein